MIDGHRRFRVIVGAIPCGRLALLTDTPYANVPRALTNLYNCLSLILNLGMLELVEKDVCFSSKAR